MKVYIAGPMRGRPGFNFPAFHRAEDKLLRLGHKVFNPARRDEDKHGASMFVDSAGDEDDLIDAGFSIREALHADTEFITLHADAICILDGWAESKGATAEVALARALGLPVYTFGEMVEQGAVAHISSPSLTAVAELERRSPIFPALLAEWPTEEVQSVSESGAMKGTKLARFDLLPTHALTEVAKHYGRTAHKYPPNNWRKGYEWSKSYAALMRHATQWWGGEDLDEELGTPHLAAVAWHALTLLEYAIDHPEYDDRPCTSSLDSSV